MKWFAVMKDREDSDWGYGSKNYGEAVRMAKAQKECGYEDAYIAVIDDGPDPVCVEEIHELPELLFQFEAGNGVNSLWAENDNIRIYAECDVPDGASEDYGYLALKDAIEKKIPGGITACYWYDGQEEHLEDDASEGVARVEIEEA